MYVHVIVAAACVTLRKEALSTDQLTGADMAISWIGGCFLSPVLAALGSVNDEGKASR